MPTLRETRIRLSLLVLLAPALACSDSPTELSVNDTRSPEWVQETSRWEVSLIAANAVDAALEDVRARVLPTLPAGPFTGRLSAALADLTDALDDPRLDVFARAYQNAERTLAEPTFAIAEERLAMAADLEAVRLAVSEAGGLLPSAAPKPR